jgi:hypothetical protein
MDEGKTRQEDDGGRRPERAALSEGCQKETFDGSRKKKRKAGNEHGGQQMNPAVLGTFAVRMNLDHQRGGDDQLPPPPYSRLPGENDVLFGRGTYSINYIGNKRYRELVRSRKAEYVACTRVYTKELIAREILDEINRRGGRFLESVVLPVATPQIKTTAAAVDPTTRIDGHNPTTKAWVMANDEKVLFKIKQSLRDPEYVALTPRGADHHRSRTTTVPNKMSKKGFRPAVQLPAVLKKAEVTSTSNNTPAHLALNGPRGGGGGETSQPLDHVEQLRLLQQLRDEESMLRRLALLRTQNMPMGTAFRPTHSPPVQQQFLAASRPAAVPATFANPQPSAVSPLVHDMYAAHPSQFIGHRLPSSLSTEARALIGLSGLDHAYPQNHLATGRQREIPTLTGSFQPTSGPILPAAATISTPTANWIASLRAAAAARSAGGAAAAPTMPSLPVAAVAGSTIGLPTTTTTTTMGPQRENEARQLAQLLMMLEEQRRAGR